MDSLYQISQELLSIFDNMESNEGVITDEEYQKLLLTKDNLKAKLGDYLKAIKVWEGQINSCKDEKKRLDTFKKVRENRIECLKSRMLQAIEQFGDVNKNGVKFIEDETYRLSVTSRKGVECYEERVELFISLANEVLGEYGESDLFEIEEENGAITEDFIKMFLYSLNTLYKNHYNEDNSLGEITKYNDHPFVEFTINDVKSIPVSFTLDTTIGRGYCTLADIFVYPSLSTILAKSAVIKNASEHQKESAKDILKDKENVPTWCRESINKSLLIK